jgi:hypothetical protein
MSFDDYGMVCYDMKLVDELYIYDQIMMMSRWNVIDRGDLINRNRNHLSISQRWLEDCNDAV